MSLKRLTPKQRRLLVVFFNYIQEYGSPPTQVYVSKVLGTHISNINQMLYYATRKGYFEKRDRRYYPTRDGVGQLREDYTSSKVLLELQQDNVRLVPVEDGEDAGKLPNPKGVRQSVSFVSTPASQLPQS